MNPSHTIQTSRNITSWTVVLALTLGIGLQPPSLQGADLLKLSKSNWDEVALKGKEIDAIYGDVLLRNHHIAVVIAQPDPKRNANMTVRSVGGSLIDLTSRYTPNDQLSCYYPAGTYRFTSWKGAQIQVDGKDVSLGDKTLSGDRHGFSGERRVTRRQDALR